MRRRTAPRTTKRQSYRQESDGISAPITDVQQEFAAATQHKKSLTAQLKALKSQMKELGHVPRHSTSGRTVLFTASILQLVGTDEETNGKRNITHSTLETNHAFNIPMWNQLSFNARPTASAHI
jgi:hypothetical protein